MPRQVQESAFAIAETMIASAPRWTDSRFRRGYFEGLVGGWYQCGIITEIEMTQLRSRMRAVQPAWWNLLGKIGM